MIFYADDLDWALGELLALIWRGKSAGIPAHRLDPELFSACMRCINQQPFAIRYRVRAIINSTNPHQVRTFGARRESATT